MKSEALRHRFFSGDAPTSLEGPGSPDSKDRGPHPAWASQQPDNPSAPGGKASAFFLLASAAGACGALSGVVGKVAVASESIPDSSVQRTAALLGGRDSEIALTVVPYLLRLLFFLLNAVFTAQMWRFYVKALSFGPTPVCSIVSTGTNFAVSALVGLLVFGEEVTALWAFGALLVVAGLALIVSNPSTVNHA